MEDLCLTIKDEFDAAIRRDAMNVLGALYEFVIARGGAAASATTLGGVRWQQLLDLLEPQREIH